MNVKKTKSSKKIVLKITMSMTASSMEIDGKLGRKFSWKAVVLVWTVRRGSGVNGVTFEDSHMARENRSG